MRTRLSVVIAMVVGCACAAVAGAGRDRDSFVQQPGGFAELFEQYRAGDADSAVAAFATWDRRRVEREARVPPGEKDEWAPAALALFHLEAALRVGRAETRPARFPWVAHRAAAARLLTREFCRSAPGRDDVRRLAFCREWYSCAIADANLAFFEATKDFLRDDAIAQLFRGRWAEFWMGPAVDSGGFVGLSVGTVVFTTSHGLFGPSAGDAEVSLKRALAIDSRLVEARVRLGRVLFLLDRAGEARRELERAVTDAQSTRDTTSEYLAALFLGQLHEQAGRREEALISYRQAAGVDTRYPAAPVAVARVLAGMGRAGEASAAIETFFRKLPSGTSAIDPWTEYPLGRAYWHREQILKTLRQAIRR